MGATTIWERWDSMLEDGTINPGEMTSFNHYAFGAIADWLHRCVAGLAPLEPGYRRSRIAPVPLPGIDHAETVHETPYGRVSVRWDAIGGDIVVQAQVPPNTSALVSLAGSEPTEVGSGSYTWTISDSRPQPTNQSLSLSSSLAEIVDDAEALSAVLDAIADIDPDRARGMRRHTAWVSQRSLEAELTLAPPAIVGRVEESLAEINARRATAAR
jgi:alpha-L-rhamnosidase